MVGFFKSLQSVFSGILADLPDGGMVFQLVTQVLPYLMWTWVIKSIVGSVFSFL